MPGMVRWHPAASLHPRGRLHIMVCVIRMLPLFFSLVAGFVNVPVHASVIKKSNSGLCHPPQSSWYERTQNYQPYDSFDACLDSDGKLPDGISFASVRQVEEKQGRLRSYERSALVTVGMMLMETVRTAVLRHCFPIHHRMSDLQTKVVVGWSQADGSVRSQARSSRTAVRLTLIT